LRGEVTVQAGQEVRPDDIVARTSLPGDATLVNVAGFLSISGEEVPGAMLKNVGDRVAKDEPIAQAKSLFGLFKSVAKASMDGTIEDVNKVTGQVLLRGAPIPVEVRAYVQGRVTEIIPEEGCVIETFGTFVQGIFGVGGETHGKLVMACSSPDQRLEVLRHAIPAVGLAERCVDLHIRMDGSRKQARMLEGAPQASAHPGITGRHPGLLPVAHAAALSQQHHRLYGRQGL